MTSKELAKTLGCTARYVRLQTKKALEDEKNIITLKGEQFKFSLISSASTRGKAYSYTPFSEKPRVAKTKAVDLADMKTISHIDIGSSVVSVEDKVLIIGFVREFNYSLNSIVKNLYFFNGVDASEKMVANGVKKVKRWMEQFKSGGVKALEDTRGNSGAFRKIDKERLLYAIVHSKALANRQGYYSVWRFYCFLVAKDEGKTIEASTKGYESIISYVAVVNGIKKLLKENHKLNVWDKKGHDGLLQDYVIGVRDIGYINQEWQVDATKFDFICKYPDGTIKRANLTIVIDSFSGGVVGKLTDTINSYDQVRVLYSAFEKMGKPEVMKTDNGKDYASEHYKKVLLENGVSQIFADVGQGRQKGKVERFFGVMQTELSLIPGYIGSSVAYRVKIENQHASKIDVRTSKATRIDTDRLLTFDELARVAENYMAKKSNNYEEFLEFRLSGAELLNIKRNLGKRVSRKLQADGIRYNKFTYQSAELWLGGLATGDMVEVVENIDNINEVFVFKKGEYIGVATNKELGVESMTLEEHKQAVKAEKENHLKPFMKIVKDTSDWEAFQDEFVVGMSGEAVEYQKEKLHINSSLNSKACNNSADEPTIPTTKLSKSSSDELYDFVMAVS